MVAYKSLKTREKSSWAIPKVVGVAYGSCRLRELFITKFKSQFKWGFAKVVDVTRAGRLQEWSQGELRLYYCYKDFCPWGGIESCFLDVAEGKAQTAICCFDCLGDKSVLRPVWMRF